MNIKSKSYSVSRSVAVLVLAVGVMTPLFSFALQQKAYAFAGGTGTSGDPYLISTPTHLASLSTYVGSVQGTTYFRLQNNIDLNVSPYNNGAGWTPIGSGTIASMFNGHLDGNGYEVQNLYINNNSTQNVGLFGSSIGTITNLGVTNASVTSTLTATNASGVGILAGRNRGNISSSYSTGSVSSTTWMVGGLVGTNEGGYGYGSVSESYSSATVSSQAPRTGGLVGENDRGAIVRSYATGNVSSTSNQIGGLAGIMLNDNGATATASIADSYSRGSVNGNSSTAGFVGATSASTTVTRSYVAGSVTGVTTPQAFAGSGATVTNSYWDSQVSPPTTTSSTGSSQTTAQMKAQGTYTGWDFSTVWGIDGTNNDGYPYLQWQDYASAPSVTTSAASSVTLNSAILNGNVTDEGTASVTRQGFVWGNEAVADPGSNSPETSGYDTVLDEATLGAGAYAESISSLSENTAYYYRAFAESSEGITYGSEQSFTTLSNVVIASPGDNSSDNSLSFSFDFYSTPLANSAQIILDGTQDYTITTNLGQGSHGIGISPGNVLGSASVTSSTSNIIQDGTYTVTIRYSDSASGTVLSDTISNFTLDATAPVLESVSPLDDSTGVAINQNLTLTFDEPVGANTGDFTIYDASDDSVSETIPAGGGPVSGNGTTTITLNPFNDLEAGTEYYVLIDSGAIQDLVGNDYTGISNSTTWSFTTVSPPQIVCEPPTSTHETATARCEATPAGWGTTTWEARYKKATDSTYIDVTLEDTNVAEFTAEGLEPETDYYLELRFDNDYNASPEGEWARLEVTTAPPPQDDFNGDGTADYYQPNISSYINPYTNKRVLIDVGEDCEVTVDDITQETNLTTQDPAFDYDNGLFDFAGDCGMPGFSTTVKLYYYGVTKDDFVLRKYNPNTNAFFNLTGTYGATIEEDVIEGQIVTVASYQISDGGDLDMDLEVNGEFEDPVGLAKGTVKSPDTGVQNLWLLNLRK